MIIEFHRLLLHSVIEHTRAHMHSKSRVSSHPILHHLLLHAQTLNLNQVLHFLLSRHVRKLTFVLLLQALILLVALLHLKFHVIEDAIEIDWIQLDRHLYCRVLLKMYKGSLSLFWVHHTCDSFDALSFFQCDFLAIKYHQLNKPLDYNHTIVGLSRDWVVDQRQVQKIWKLS